jgi:endoribonuclease LACTB2
MQVENLPGLQVLPLRTPTLPPATHTNCYLLGEERLWIVDPGSPYENEIEKLADTLAAIRAAGISLEAIFLTHHHPDHIGSVAAISKRFDLPVAAHPLTLARIDGNHREISLDEGSSVELDHLRCWKAWHTPGHAPGHLCLYSESDGLLIAGDMIPGIGTILIDPSEGDMKAYLHHLGRLADLNPHHIYPAHGPRLDEGRKAINNLIAHRLMREERIFDTLGKQNDVDNTDQEGQPRDISYVVAKAYDDVPPAAIPFALRSTEAHLLKLVDDGRVVRTDDDRWLALKALPETMG